MKTISLVDECRDLLSNGTVLRKVDRKMMEDLVERSDRFEKEFLALMISTIEVVSNKFISELSEEEKENVFMTLVKKELITNYIEQLKKGAVL